MRDEPVSPEQVRAYQLGLLYTELNTIFRRIRRRTLGEPTTKERERILELQELIREYKSGERDA